MIHVFVCHSVSRSPSSSSLPYGPEDGGFNRSLQSALDRLGSQQYGLKQEEGGGQEPDRQINTVSPPRMSEVEKRL
jgi:hypothetical protein